MKDTSRLNRKSVHDIQFSTEEVGIDPFQAPCKATKLLPVLCVSAGSKQSSITLQ